jgi:hypothetical protein
MITLPRTTRGAPVIVYGLVLVDGDDVPQLLAGRGVERDEPPVDRPGEDLAFPHRDPAVDHVAAGMRALGADRLGVVAPQDFAGRGVDRHHLRPRGGDVHHPVDHHRGRLLPAVGIEVDGPGEAELADVPVVDVGQRAEALLGVGASVAEPVVRVAIRGEQARFGDIPGLGFAVAGGERQHRGQREGSQDRLSHRGQTGTIDGT